MNKIREFKELHLTGEVLFLGNAWDVLSALILEKARFKAIGTTSWGVANSLGYEDGELVDFQRHLGVIKSIAENVKIPVSADIEAGYGEDMQTIIDNVLRTADAGVAGINIEDSFKKQKGLKEIKEHSNLLGKIRTALEHNGYKDFYINARTDTYLQMESPLRETIERASCYVESGASGVFVPGVTKKNEIKELAAEIKAPLNVFSLPGLTDCSELKDLGVKRFSFGNALSDQVISFLEKSAAQLLESRNTQILYEG